MHGRSVARRGGRARRFGPVEGPEGRPRLTDDDGGVQPHGVSHVEHNRRFWDADADDYQAAHGEALTTAPLAWGAYRVPESDLQVLGDVRGRDVLELGCGGAQWSIGLAALGTQIVGLDLSTAQLAYARASAPKLPLVLANGERL